MSGRDEERDLRVLTLATTATLAVFVILVGGVGGATAANDTTETDVDIAIDSTDASLLKDDSPSTGFSQVIDQGVDPTNDLEYGINRTYHRVGNDYFDDLDVTSDGGYVIVGSAENATDSGDRDAWIVKVDANGNEEWNTTLATGNEETFNAVVEASDGGYLAVGQRDPFGEEKAWAAKFDSSGNVEWNRTYAETKEHATFQDVVVTETGFAVAGARSVDDEFTDGWVVELNATGVLETSWVDGGPQHDRFVSLDRTSDGGYVAAGTIGSDRAHLTSSTNGWMVKFSPAMGAEWNRSYGQQFLTDDFRHVRQTSDGGFVAAGSAVRDTEDTRQDAWLMKVAGTGPESWNRTYDPVRESWEWWNDVHELPNGDFFLVGKTDGYNPDGDDDGWLMRVNDTGLERSNWTIDGGSTEELTSMVATDGPESFAVVGHSNAWDPGYAGWLLEVDLNASVTPANFGVTVDSTNAPITAGETLTVEATVENTGGAASTQKVNLSIDGSEIDSKSVTLNGGESTTVTLSWTSGAGDAGTHTATVATANDSASAAATVESAPTGGANQVDECTVIDQPGRHVLTQSITNSSAGTCIEITASGVVLDGQGHTVNGVDASSGIGIEVDGAGTVENVTVQDVELVEWETAIPLGTVSNVTVEGTTLRNNHGGIAVGSEAVDNTVRDNTVNGSEIAGIAVSGTNNTVRANEIKNNDDGILVLESGSGGTTLADNVARNNTNSGIRIQTTGIRLENNTVGDNQFGIWFRGGSDTVARNTTFENNSERAVLANPDGDAQSSANNTFTDVDLGYDNATLSFTLRDVALTPEGATDAPAPPTGKADIGVYVNASSTSATGSLDLEVVYDDAAVSTVDESTLSLWNHDGGWTDLGGTLDAGTNTLSKNVTSFSVFAPLADSDDGPGQPDFSVEIVDTNSPVNETGTLNVTAAVTNTGNGTGTQTVALSTNETPTVDSRSVALEPGSSAEVMLSWATGADDAGDYVATVDSANDSDSTAVTVRAVDLTPPTVELTAIDANGSAATPPTGQIVHTNGTVSFEVAANGTPGDASSVTVTLEATFANFDHEIEADHQGGTTWTATEDLAALADDGTYAVNVSAVDAAGNKNETAGDALVRFDREPPELGATVSRLDGGNASVNVTASEALAEAPTIEVAHNGTTETATIADSGDTYWNATFGLAGGGQYNVTAIGTDLAGNEGTGTASARIDTVETENDTATVVLDPSGLFVTFTTDAAVNDTVVVTESNTPLAPLAPGDAGVNFLNAQLGDHIAGNLSHAVIGIPVDMSEVPASVDRNAVGIRYYNETTSSWELQATTIEERTILGTTGEYWVANVSQFSTYGALASDETAPTLDTASPAGELATGTTDATVRFEYQDAISGVDASAVSLSFDASDVTDDATTSITSQFATYDITGLSTGSHTATVTVEDVAGNSVSYETTFTVPVDDGDDETASSPGQPPSVHDEAPGRFSRSIVDRNPDEPGVQVPFDDTAVAALTFEDEALNGSGEVSIEPGVAPPDPVVEAFGSAAVVSSVDIEVPAAAEDAPARITFSLSASVVGDRDIDSLQVVRVVAGESQPLSTEVTEQPDGSVSVVAETPGFSTFVVVSVAEESDSPGEASTVTETATATPGPTPTSEEPSPTMTPASTPTEVPGGMPGFGHLVAVVALLAVGLYARRHRR